MKQFLFVLVVAALAGCKQKPTGPATYQYKLSVGHLPGSSGFEVVLNGVATGTAANFTVRRDVHLADASNKLELVVPTTCGAERIPLKPSYGLDRAAEDKARATSVASVSWSVDVPAEIRELPLYLDNALGAAATTIRIGAHEEKVAAGEAVAKRITMGTCATARDLVIDGRAAGQVPTTSSNMGALLVGRDANQCYVSGWAMYTTGKAGGVFDPTRILPDVEVFRVEGHASIVPRVTYFPERAAPREKWVDKAAPDDTIKVMSPIACEIAAAFTKAKASRGARRAKGR
jgi:hypothetical protein